MTAVQLDSMTAQAYRDLTAITENENVFRVVARYLRKKVQELATDPTEMTKPCSQVTRASLTTGNKDLNSSNIEKSNI